MSSVRTCALVGFLLFAPALPSIARAESCGWGRIQWGMNPDEVARSTGMSIIATPKDKMRGEGQYFSKTSLLTRPFEVYFLFDKQEKLVRILFYSYQTGAFSGVGEFQRIRDRLAEKYGRPALWPESPERRVLAYKWVTTCQVIDLIFIEPKGSDSDTLSLTYRPNESIHDEQF